MFVHDFIELPTIHNEDTDNGRFYVTPEGNRYQSVTTFLGKFSDNSWVEEWKARVGEEEANRVSAIAKRRGTAVHSILEQIALNNKQYARCQMPNNLTMAESIANVLRARVSVIKGIEIGLWSDLMKIAGRADMLGVFDGKLSIIDFKTAKQPKREEDIHNYFLQCTLYAIMVEELLRIPVPQIVVLIGVDFEPAQVFVKNKKDYIDEIIRMVKALRK